MNTEQIVEVVERQLATNSGPNWYSKGVTAKNKAIAALREAQDCFSHAADVATDVRSATEAEAQFEEIEEALNLIA